MLQFIYHSFTIRNETKKYIRRERNFGSYKRQFYLGDINEDEIKAEFNNGILKVFVPKKEIIDTKKKIEIDQKQSIFY